MKLNKIISILISVVLMTSILNADNTQLIKETFNKKLTLALKIAKDKTIDKQTRNNKIVDIMSPIFDFELMARLTLGKNIWHSMTKSQRTKFTQLYIKRMENSYSSKLDSYTNEKILITEVKQLRKNRAILKTKIVGKNEDIDVNYKYYKTKKHKKNKQQWLIYDVDILGVSIIKTDKAQFRDILQEHTIDQLMQQMTKVKPKKTK